MKSAHPGFFTIDVEDYYHFIHSSAGHNIEHWDKMPSRVEYGLMALFDILAERGIHATCFFLGYIAKRHPDLVKRAVLLGHEIASHGMYHQIVPGMTRAEFQSEARDSKALLEDISGSKVRGWRCAGFNLDRRAPWFFEELVSAGYQYDSSLLPNRSKHHFFGRIELEPYKISTWNGSIWEFPISVSQICGLQVCMFGGVYLRFFPSKLIENMAAKLLPQYPLNIYIHPREMDISHPRLGMNPVRFIKSYLNLSTVPIKLKTLLGMTNYITLDEYLVNRDTIS